MVLTVTNVINDLSMNVKMDEKITIESQKFDSGR